MDGAVHVMGVIHWSLFTDSIFSLSMGSSCCFFLAGYTYIKMPPFRKFTWHAYVGTYSIHRYPIGTSRSMSQKHVGGYQKHGLIKHDLEVEVKKMVESIYKNWITQHLPFPITEGIKTLQWGSNTNSREWKDCMLERREINSRQPREPRSEHIYLTT